MGKVNLLQRNLPDGMVVDAGWLEHRGYSRSLRAKYVKSGWLDQVSRGVYRRAAGRLDAPDQKERLKWQQVVISLQSLLERPFRVGGRSALELQGFGHYLAHEGTREVHLYGDPPWPTWVVKLSLAEDLVFHNAGRLFTGKAQTFGLTSQEWGSGDWPLILATPERAMLEVLDEVPRQETFHQADVLMEGLRNLSPGRLQTLLSACRSVKVKRLFLWFAERHGHAWLKNLDIAAIDLGSGKRVLVRGGRLDRKYNITVPGDLDAL